MKHLILVIAIALLSGCSTGWQLYIGANPVTEVQNQQSLKKPQMMQAKNG